MLYIRFNPEGEMKITVKVGEIYHRVEVGDVDKKTQAAVAHHVRNCSECQRMIYNRPKKKYLASRAA